MFQHRKYLLAKCVLEPAWNQLQKLSPFPGFNSTYMIGIDFQTYRYSFDKSNNKVEPIDPIDSINAADAPLCKSPMVGVFVCQLASLQ